MKLCRIEQGLFQRFILVNAEDARFAWSGNRWVPHWNGVPTGVIQVANFATEAEARKAAADYDLRITPRKSPQ